MHNNSRLFDYSLIHSSKIAKEDRSHVVGFHLAKHVKITIIYRITLAHIGSSSARLVQRVGKRHTHVNAHVERDKPIAPLM